MSISVIIEENIDFSRNLQKNLRFLVKKKLENLDFGQNFRKISILVNIYENFDLGQKLMKISILVKIVEKSWSCSIFSENLDFCQYLR